MNVSPSAPDRTDAEDLAQILRIIDEAASVDGYRPLNEQTLLDLESGKRTGILLTTPTTAGVPTPVGVMVVGAGELDLVVAPTHRGCGHADRALTELLDGTPDALTAWSHGDHPAARVLAVRHRFAAVRTLLHLRKLLATDAPAGPAAPGDTDAPTITAFRPGIDDEEWVALNALAFAGHSEQGQMSAVDLAARQSEGWFDRGDFLIARDSNGRMIGFNWLKVEAGAEAGELYAIAVHPDAAGRGLGRGLMRAGLDRLRERGCTDADLYVEADNTAAVSLYRSLGFTDHTIDVQYRRVPR